MLLVALVLLVLAGRGQNFFYDDWAFVGRKLDSVPLPDRYLLPHNEHWSLLPLMAFRTLGATVGVGSYWPYLGVLLLLHLSVTHVLWRLMLVTGSKPIVATAFAAVFSVLGAGAENLVWAFQIGFVGSSLLGVSAVYLAVTGGASSLKTGVLACLTLTGLATSGVGLAYLVVVPLIYTRRRGRGHAAVVLGVPLVVYLSWYSVYGRAFAHPATPSAELPVMLGAFVVVGLTTTLARYFGFANNPVSFLVVGVPILAWLTLACRNWWADRTLASGSLLAMSMGAVMFFGSVGLARAGLGLGFATASRYMYVAIALLMPALASVISDSTDRRPQLIKAVVPFAIAMAVSSVFQLFAYAAETRHNNDTSRRVLVAASALVRSNAPVFIDQLPEPRLAPDLTTADLRSRHLDPAFEGVSPSSSDRLEASLNLQIQVAPVRDTSTRSNCVSTLVQQITMPTSRATAPRFTVSTDAPVTLTLHSFGLRPASRLLDLHKGIYLINSLRDPGDLTIESTSPASLSTRC